MFDLYLSTFYPILSHQIKIYEGINVTNVAQRIDNLRLSVYIKILTTFQITESLQLA